MRPRSRALAATSLLASLALTGLALTGLAQDPVPRFTPPALGDLRLVPECERTWRRIVIGLETNRTRYFMLPSTEAFDPRSRDPRVRHLRRQIYWLNFELVRGGLMRASPRHSRFFVAVPDPAYAPESIGNEEEVFRDYLQTRVGWSADEVAERVRFFKVPVPVVFTRDVSQPLGLDSRKRLVLGVGEDQKGPLMEMARRLVAAFPDEFALRTLPGIDAEGGDIEITELPGRGLAVLVGHHRVREWIARHRGESTVGRPVSEPRIEEARLAFSRAFLGLPAHIVTEGDLREPSLASPELFHLDMTVNPLRVGGRLLAFVPTYVERPADAITHVVLAPDVRARLQRTWDAVASQMSDLGFGVSRLPCADHPVRTPVNVGKYRDPQTGAQVVLLGKYPDHIPGSPGGQTVQRELQAAFDRLDASVETWRLAPGDDSWTGVTVALQEAWWAMDRAAAAPNPSSAAQIAVYEKAGVRVIPVPMYPTGGGGLHCLALASGLEPAGAGRPGLWGPPWIRPTGGRGPELALAPDAVRGRRSSP